MKLFHVSPSKLSIFCASSAVPSVQVTSACVSPRVKTAEPWVRGSTPVSIQIGRISSNFAAVESHAVRSSTSSRSTFSLSSLKICLASSLALDFALRQRGDQLVEHLVDAVVVFELAADPHRLGQRHEHLLLDLAVELVADLLLRDRELLLAGVFARRSSIVATICLMAACAASSASTTCCLGHLLGAGLDHHEAVLAAGDDEIELALLALLERRD